MATLGLADLKDTALPSLWDSGELEQIRLADGTTFDQLEALVRAGLAEMNASLLSMSHYGDLFSVDDEAEQEYPIGVTNGVEEATEYGMPDPKRGATTGHMLPLKKWDRALGWTMMYLREARRAKLDADVRAAMNDIRDNWQKRLLTRFFTSTGNTVGSTSNADVPFADAGSTDSTYVPPDSPEGESFDTTHTHLLRHAAISDTNLATTVEHLQEHGHQSPFDCIASRTDVSSWTGLTGFKAPEWPGILYHASGVERANVPEMTTYLGYVETDYGIVRIWPTPRVPTNYYGLFKSYGPGDPRNSLKVRISQAWGWGWRLVPGTWVNAPQMVAVMYNEFGVGVGDRVGGVLVEIDSSGSYATPTIS